MVKRIAILGSTGSIGRQTLEVIEALGEEYKVVVLTAGSNDQLLGDQIRRFKPEFAVLTDTTAAERLAKNTRDTGCAIHSGRDGQLRAAAWPSADLMVMAQVGFSGFEPVAAALKEGKTIALANKESLVIGGEILLRHNLLKRDKILPVDSEHSAIWQCLGSATSDQLRRIFLTASGGPFYGRRKEELEQVTPAEALDHPNWQMGSKITIDSATMMNKGLEVIEAKWLFDLSLDQIEVVIHRQSIVHSMVEYNDGSILAQLGLPDMRLPIQLALTYPERVNNQFEKYNPFGQTLEFDNPDRDNFPCLDLAYRASRSGGTMPAVLNGANEIAVASFLAGVIRFTDIPIVIERVMQNHRVVQKPEIDCVVRADQWSRQQAEEIIAEKIGGVN